MGQMSWLRKSQPEAQPDIQLPIPPAIVRPFDTQSVVEILSWVRGDAELCRLAPGTPPPLTIEKIQAWHKPGSAVYALHADAGAAMIGYAELNPMRDEPRHFWLGHILIKPDLRGKGWGRALVTEMVRIAFEERDALRVSLLVFPDNEPALRCYRALGFVERGAEVHLFPATQKTHRMLRLELGR
ncbi:MAG: GNAT family N-acetyltransferase [Burkholderiales bacterium]